MQLGDFYISSRDLKVSNLLFVETKENLIPVTDIKFNNGKIIIINKKNQKFLNLNEFYLKTKKYKLTSNLYYQLNSILPILGYRIENHKIIF